MNPALLSSEVQDFIKNHEYTPLDKLIFKGSPFSHVTIQEIAQQIRGRQKAKSKLPQWYQTPGVLYPPSLNLEQTSSEATAQYKASLVTGNSLADLTGGLGVDAYYFAQNIAQVTHYEINEEVHALAKANFKTLKASQINTHLGDGIKALEKAQFDNIYVDPSRRHEHKGKVFLLKDCLPNIPLHLDLLLNSCNALWIKTAPILDITAGLRELQHVTEIHIVAVKNEVKELLWKMSLKDTHALRVIAVNIQSTSVEKVQIKYNELQEASATYSFPKAYLYEPNASLFKAGAFQYLSQKWQVDKFSEHAHLYTSERLLDFPGRRFRILETLPFSKKLRTLLPLTKAHITTRDFKLKPEQLRKSLKLKDGGNTYLFFTTLLDGKAVCMVTEKV